MITNTRVVVTGLGIVAPGAQNTNAFLQNLKAGKSGIAFLPDLAENGFECQIGGIAKVGAVGDETWYDYFDLEQASDFIQLACKAGVEAWESSGLTLPDFNSPAVDWDTGMIIGSGFAGMDVVAKKVVPLTKEGNPKKLGSFGVQHTMGSGAAAQLSTILGIGNQVTANSSACCTGTEAILDAYYKIQTGLATRMVVGSVEGYSPYIWAQFDAARVLNRKFNDRPQEASRPMSESARGVVPSSGAGVLIIETLASATDRGAPIYAEILGGLCNSGGQRGTGSMTYPNNEGVLRCLTLAMERTGVSPEEINLISGHLTATKADPLEVKNWKTALQLPDADFPMINAPKSIFGHALAGAGSLESVACILQLHHRFIHPSINCKDIHQEISKLILPEKIPQEMIEAPDLNIVMKASFGFGDVNACLIFRRWNSDGT
ncbi:MAG: 3-oxoacyl-(acyl-carrier-protein) synthase [Saprospiraceae bacterium]|jgi:3-oxoacyl-(acyl-carrier-protein) synthase